MVFDQKHSHSTGDQNSKEKSTRIITTLEFARVQQQQCYQKYINSTEDHEQLFSFEFPWIELDWRVHSIVFININWINLNMQFTKLSLLTSNRWYSATNTVFRWCNKHCSKCVYQLTVELETFVCLICLSFASCSSSVNNSNENEWMSRINIQPS